MPKAAAVAFLRTVSVFKDLAEPNLVALALRLRERQLKKGEVLFREGDKGNEMFRDERTGIVIELACDEPRDIDESEDYKDESHYSFAQRTRLKEKIQDGDNRRKDE